MRGAAIEERLIPRFARNDGFLNSAQSQKWWLFFYQEGIALAFFADGGGEAVAGIDDGVVRKCQ